VLAFDTGPANALLDAVARAASNGVEHCDVDGAGAARGRVDDALLDRLLAEPYYAAVPPKTTGKELFSADYLDRHVTAYGTDVATDDLLATLTELTARTVADALRPHEVAEVFVSGGGVRNPTLLGRLREHLGVPVRPTSGLGLAEEAKEAYLFALLGFLTWHGLPGTVPSATGARRAAIAGRITPGHAPLRLPEPAPRAPTRLVVR
jgi:anhydro-N-acetylmuramic acid kinase